MIKVLYLLIMFPMGGNPTLTGHVIETFDTELACLKTEALLDKASKDNTYECHEFTFNIPSYKDK